MITLYSAGTTGAESEEERGIFAVILCFTTLDGLGEPIVSVWLQANGCAH